MDPLPNALESAQLMKSTPQVTAFVIPLRIYYEDTDAGGVVYYANYLKFFERCRTEWLRAVGHQQADLLRDPGIAFVVRSASIDYLKPARLDDQLVVGLEVERLSHAQIFFRQYVRRADEQTGGDGEDLVRAKIHIVCVNSALMKATAIPSFLRSKLEALQ
jgi:acyl-CoA thioester hydrolase